MIVENIVYGVFSNDIESFSLYSLHQTKKGAYITMKKILLENFNKHRNLYSKRKYRRYYNKFLTNSVVISPLVIQK